MSTLNNHIKAALGRNLSLSSRLSLRGLYSSAAKIIRSVLNFPGRTLVRVLNSATARLGIEYSLGRKTAAYSIDMPSMPVGEVPYPRGPRSSKPGKGRAILTSIIIPVFNKAEFTFQCLKSLVEEVDLGQNEVIVVDNASTDETVNVLAHFKNVVRVIRNQENRGFVDACNQGAAAAKGKYLLFLNNDTRVLPGWLDHLVETIEADPANGAVGSMFLYPDGSIQEAGSIVWKNGEAHRYGWSASPDDRRFNFAREVDYCSGASLLVRKDIFDQLGGFDRRFAPAYYEDVDLCFGVRSLGYRVIYQPMSRIVHYEGVTAGSDVTRGIKHFQVLNRPRFLEKWRQILEAEHFEKNPKRVFEAAHRRLGPNVLVFDERIPGPDRDAGSARMLMTLKAVAKRCHVVFIPLNRAQGSEYEEALWKEGIETAEAEDYRRLLKKRDVHAVIISRPTISEAMIARIRRSKKSVKIIVDIVGFEERLDLLSSLRSPAEPR